jgi:hypothetical protein
MKDVWWERCVGCTLASNHATEEAWYGHNKVIMMSSSLPFVFGSSIAFPSIVQ